MLKFFIPINKHFDVKRMLGNVWEELLVSSLLAKGIGKKLVVI